MHAVIFIDVHTLLCSNLFALFDTPNIVTPDTTLSGPSFAGQLLGAPPRSMLTKTSRVTARLQEAKIKLSVKVRERKGLQTFGNNPQLLLCWSCTMPT